MRTSYRAMTLIELLVAIGIMLIVMEGFTLLFLKSWDTNKFILEEGMASAAASHATNKIIRELRSVRQADNGDFPVESGSDFDLKVYGDIDDDGVTERMHYFLDLDADELKIGVTKPIGGGSVSYPAPDDTVSVLARYVVNESDDPVFYYYNKNYPGDVVNNPLATPISVADARLIRVHLLVNINPVHAPDNINIESFADLRNLKTYE
ncbi:MAG: prepilin-type N-terminal cleavage/methylation domain-containing protein [Candidatus Moraniibacteriota bacterium]